MAVPLQGAFRSAGDVARHVLRTQGVKTTQELFEACMAIKVKGSKAYVGPGQRDYRYTDGRALSSAHRDHHYSEHLVRSMRHLKLTMRDLETQGIVGHATMQKVVQLMQQAKTDETTIQAAEQRLEQLKTSKSSPFVWIEGQLWNGLKSKSTTDKPTTASAPSSKGERSRPTPQRIAI